MKRISPLNPYTTYINIKDDEIGQVVVKTPEAINQHAEEIEKLQDKIKILISVELNIGNYPFFVS